MNNATNSFLNVVHEVLAYPLFTLGERSLTVALVGVRWLNYIDSLLEGKSEKKL